MFRPSPIAEIELLETFSAPVQKSLSTLGAVMDAARVVMTAPFILEVATSLIPRPKLMSALTAAPSPEMRRFLLPFPSISKDLSSPANCKIALSTLIQTKRISPPLIAIGEIFTDVARGSTGNFDGMRIFTSCVCAYVGSGVGVSVAEYVIVAVGCEDAELDGEAALEELVGDGAWALAVGKGVGRFSLFSSDDPVITSASDGRTCTAKMANKAAAATRLARIERRELMR